MPRQIDNNLILSEDDTHSNATSGQLSSKNIIPLLTETSSDNSNSSNNNNKLSVGEKTYTINKSIQSSSSEDDSDFSSVILIKKNVDEKPNVKDMESNEESNKNIDNKKKMENDIWESDKNENKN